MDVANFKIVPITRIPEIRTMAVGKCNGVTSGNNFNVLCFLLIFPEYFRHVIKLECMFPFLLDSI